MDRARHKLKLDEVGVEADTRLKASLNELAHRCSAQDQALSGVLRRVQRARDTLPPSIHYNRFPLAICRIIAETLPPADVDGVMRAKRYVVANLLIGNASRLLKRYSHPMIAACMVRNLDRIASNLLGADDDYAVYDHFVKDVNYVSGAFVHLGARAISLNANASLSSLVSRPALGAYSGAGGWIRAVARGGRGWFRAHTDNRMMEDFNELGSERFYRNVAALLQDNPKILGLVSTTWFLDPQILTIAPHLAYWQLTPVKHGAFLYRHGPTAQHTAWAIEKSQTRRKLVEEGRYVPQCYSMTWPRKALCNWAGIPQ
ncbi:MULTISPECIES: hypothetical protein [Rhodomicrobium]|uniref:hypothetical protein n=1 Tax=Rhodomicrobium TaxID=1068 RepID=UPI000F73BF55|nr:MULTISPECIES: hypothetical protein [Rhodomicrobium]